YIIKNMENTMRSVGFSVVVPMGTAKGELPIVERNGHTIVQYSGKKGSALIDYFEGKISLLCASSEAENAVDDDYKKISTTLFDAENADDRDLKYVVNDFKDGIVDTFGKKGGNSKKLPQPVSKAAAKSGTVYFDLVTLGSRFVTVYPELKENYKENIDKYGEFLADDFFLNYGNEKFRATVKQNDPVQMKKVFNMLNNVYNDGTNQVQSVIVVTILGSLYDDEQLLANCVDYMEDMKLSVIETNKLLRKSTFRSKLEHPPLYKPKKVKKMDGFLNQLNGGN
ncbi:MAG: hypothetical protein KBT46_00800, partial [Ruminococcus sp.]|nr:hypothetical protein [Candidatus Copronaster equi]